MFTFVDKDSGKTLWCSTPKGAQGQPYKEVPDLGKDNDNTFSAIVGFDSIGHPIMDTTILDDLFVKQVTDYLQSDLDALAKSWGYDDINAIAKYLANATSPFNAECQLLADYTDSVWGYGSGLLDAWKAGGAKPSMDEIIVGMPVKPVKPV